MTRFVLVLAAAVAAWFTFSYLMGFPHWVDVAALVAITVVVTRATREGAT